jgi:hypothetical protein
MTKEKKKLLVLELLQAIDYDHYKFLAYPEECEDPDASIDLMSECLKIISRYVN